LSKITLIAVIDRHRLSFQILQTKFLNETGVVALTDFLPRQPSSATAKPLLHWLIRRVEVCITHRSVSPFLLIVYAQVIRGSLPLRVEIAPAFDYARAPHETCIIIDDSVPPRVSSTDQPIPDAAAFQEKFLFHSEKLSLDCRYVVESTIENVPLPQVNLKLLNLTNPTEDGGRGHLGLSGSCDLELVEGQAVTFILRSIDQKQIDRDLQCSKNTDTQLAAARVRAQLIPSIEKAKSLGVDYDSE
jgi:hypothetical protein